MKALKSICVGAAVIIAFAPLTGCNYYKQQTGYLVTRSETFTHHYPASECPEFGLAKDSCDYPEVRYTLLHRGVKTVAFCQAWDPKAECSSLQVGNAYDCSSDFPNVKWGLPSLNCKDNGWLGIERSEQN